MSNVGPGAGDAGGSNEPNAGENANKGANDAGNQQGQNNEPNNGDDFEKIWHNPDEGQQNLQNQPGQQTQTPTQTQTPENADASFNTYIDNLGLTKELDLGVISEELNQGNTEGLGKAFSSVAAKVYRQAMVDMSKVVDQKVAAGIKAAVTQSGNATQGDMAVRQMNTAMQFTTNPAIAPIAQAALSQLIKKGKTVDEAIDGVRSFFQNTSKISAKELGMQNPPRSRPGNQPFQNSGDIAPDGDEEVDWLEMLGV